MENEPLREEGFMLKQENKIWLGVCVSVCAHSCMCVCLHACTHMFLFSLDYQNSHVFMFLIQFQVLSSHTEIPSVILKSSVSTTQSLSYVHGILDNKVIRM